MNHPLLKRLAVFAIASGAVGLTACGSDVTSSGTEPANAKPQFTVGDAVTPGTEATVNRIVLCKTGNVDGTFTITTTPANGGTPSVIASPVTVPTGTCKVVVEDFGGSGVGSFTTIDETSAGQVSAVARFWNGSTNSASDELYTDNSTQLFTNNFHGWRITYDNFVASPPPPPPPAGNLGCSPGYWKNHGFPAGYAKTDLFNSDIPGTNFANAFPTKSFQTVLSTGGGGLISLGRHTVSAYFNAVSFGAGYPLTPAQVVSMFNAASVSGDYGPTSDLFSSYEDVNGRICPNPTGK